MNKKVLALALAIVFVLSVALTGCAPQQPAAPTTPTEPAKDKQELTINLYQEVGTLDWQKCSSSGEIQIYSWLMEGLTRSWNGQVIPGAAEKWDISPDGKVYTFHLRDAKWTDGQPVTADDFYYGWMRALDPKEPKDYTYFLYDIVGAEEYSTGKGTAEQVGLKVIDPKTFEVTLKTPVTYFDYMCSFVTFAPVRKDFFEKVGATAFNTEAQNFLTNGPFKLDSWKHESEMVFVKNPDYWNAEKVKLEKVTGLMITEDSTEFNMYEAGELDHTIALDADQKAAMTKGEARTYSDGSVWYFLFNTTDKVLKNKNIRKALTLGVDRKSFIENVAKAPWKPALAFVQPDIIPDVDGTPFRNKTPEYFKDNDVETAKKLLEQGLKELGLTSLPKFKLMTNDAAKSQTYAQAFQEMWKKNLGVECEIEPVPSAVRIDRQHKHDYQISMAGWGPDYPDPMTDLDLWVTGSGNNDPAYNNPEYDALIKAAKVEPDKNKKFEMMHKAEDVLMEDMPIGPLWFRYRDYAVREYVKDFYRNSFAPDIDIIYTYIEGKGK